MQKIIYAFIFTTLLSCIINSVNAQTWQGRHNGLPTGFSVSKVYGDSNSILVSNSNAFSNSQVYTAPDSTMPFSASTSTLGMFATMESDFVKARGILFVASTVGIFKSHDKGVTWSAVTTGSIYALYVKNDTIYASFGILGVKMSADTGNTWIDMHITVGAFPVSFMKTGGTLFVGATTGLYITSDNGSTWNTVATHGLVGAAVAALAALDANAYAATNNGVFRSTDNGATWTNVLAQSMYSLIAIDTTLLGGTNTYGIYKSDHTGTIWSQMNNGLPHTGGAYNTVSSISFNNNFIIASAGGDSSIYAIRLSEVGLHISHDTDTTIPNRTASVTKTEVNCTVYPNPAVNNITIKMANTYSGISFTLLDISGRCVQVGSAQNSNYIKLDPNNTPAGVYMMQIIADGRTITKRLTVIK